MMSLVSGHPPWPQGQTAVHDPVELAGLHYTRVAQSLASARRRASILADLFGPAVVYELILDLEAARDELPSVWAQFAEAVNRERIVKAMAP